MQKLCPQLLSGSEGWVIRRDTFSPTFNTGQMLARTQLPKVPPISLASKAGMWFEHAPSLATHLRAKKCTTVAETGHCFLLSLCGPYPIHKSLRGQSQKEKRHCKVILFLPGLCSACSHSSLPLCWLCADTHSELPQPEAGNVQSGGVPLLAESQALYPPPAKAGNKS